MLLGIATLIVGGAFAVSIVGAQQQARSGFTQLWMLPASSTSKVDNSVNLGVSNKESTPMQYHLAVDINGKLIKDWPAIDLSPNQQWKFTLVLQKSLLAGSATTPAKIEALLYRASDPKHYIAMSYCGLARKGKQNDYSCLNKVIQLMTIVETTNNKTHLVNYVVPLVMPCYLHMRDSAESAANE